ncbi:hypothetical protein sscle_07g061740 [Sclerotinia sclerotiorum 1980 UF-70]|uniref:Uncharacterized protein n=1 Tax=Sclerotinia sclerotiorum (strain ATCC 18683 / 1980 / Ss-1) TaxID=665079 RepID=A0A1D9Q8X8_SCLS1|nr:hypothetical protein sscle_07g061740 [Sclerotinia sclerotiorum 1980 UF-70]
MGNTVEGESNNTTTPQKFVIGVDFGTTFTSLLSIKNWPDDLSSGDAGGTRPQVPTETWYSTIPLSREAPEDIDEDGGTSEEFVYADNNHPLTSIEDPNIDSQPDNLDLVERFSEFFWGYQVHHQQYRENISRDTRTRVKRSKLWLVQTPYTREDRIELVHIIEYLIENYFIRKHGLKDEPDVRDVLDTFIDFLVKVLHHTKEQLTQLHNFSHSSVVEFSLTVPTIWSPKASRILQNALQTAARVTKFGDMSTKKAVIPYTVSEPEAAAIYMLARDNSVHPGETFIIADCGGGTVDIVTLRDEHYLLDIWPEGETLESIVNRFLPNFENEFKRRKDFTAIFGLKTRIPLPGLRPNAEKRFDDGYIVILKQDWEGVFKPLLERVKNLLHTQLCAALQKNFKVKKVFLPGGFGASPSLRSYLRSYLREMSNKPETGYEIELKDRKRCLWISVCSMDGPYNSRSSGTD